MDKGDYSEVKELITTNSNCPTAPFDGESVVFYGSAKDESFQKGGHLRSFRKNVVDVASRHDLKVGYNSQRSEKDPSAWAMVHEVGHALHFSEAAADIAFVTKNALALRDAHSKESQTAPFKSIQTLSTEKQTTDHASRVKQNGNVPSSTARPSGNMANHGASNIFSFNSSRNNVKATATEAEPLDYDSNFEKESTASFDFNRAAPHRPVVGPLTKPTPSKWDDAEKWLSAGEAPAKPRPKNSPLSAAATAQSGVSATLSARKGDAYPNPQLDAGLEGTNGVDVPNLGSKLAKLCKDGSSSSSGANSFDGDDMSPEKCNDFLVDCTKVDHSSKKGLPRFAFMPSGKPVPLPLPMAPVDLYPLEDVYDRDDSNAKDSSMYIDAASESFSKPGSYRTVKPAAGVLAETLAKPAGSVEEPNDPSPPRNPSDADEYGEPAVVNMRTVCMRDMGTEMTPMASVEPSRTATPLMATTPNLGSPENSRPSSPGRTRNTTPASSSSKDCKGGPKTIEGGPKAALSGKDKTRAEILALGTQLGKANITAWATKEEEEADAAQALKASLEMEEVRKNLLASRAAAWEEAEQAKYMARFKREEAKIQAWENHEKAKAEAEMRRVEVKVERMRSHANEKLMNKLAAARRHAEDLRAKAEALRCEQAAKTATWSEHICRTGKIPSSFFGHLCG